MKKLFICLFVFISSILLGQDYSESEKFITYKIQVISNNYKDSTKFKYFSNEYKCEIEKNKSKIGDKWVYLITPKENTLCSANVLLDETFYHFHNPFIVIYYKGKRQK